MASAAKPALLSDRLKNQFAPIYLTLTSIIQALTMRQVSTLDAENAAVAVLLRDLQRLRGVLNACILVFALAVALLYDALQLERVALPLAMLALVAITAFVGSSVPYWNRLLAYAQTELRAASQPDQDPA